MLAILCAALPARAVVESDGANDADSINLAKQYSNSIVYFAIRGIEADFGPEHADTFRRDLHPDLRADYVLANRPSTTPTGSARTTTCAGSSASRPRATGPIVACKISTGPLAF